jgi:hypothetical protein
MILHTEQLLFDVGHRSNGARHGVGCARKTGRRFQHVIAVAHPANQALVQAFIQRRVRLHLKFGFAELFFIGGCNTTAHHVRHELVPVADAKNGNAGMEKTVGALRRFHFVDELGPPEKMTPLGLRARIFSSGASCGKISQ